MDHPSLVLVNRIARGLTPLANGATWFSSLPEAEKRSTLLALGVLCREARATDEDLEAAAEWSAHRMSSGAFKFMLDGTLADRVAKMNKAPPVLWAGFFELLVGLLAVADARRRTRDCAGGCSHWWHQSLDRSASEE